MSPEKLQQQAVLVVDVVHQRTLPGKITPTQRARAFGVVRSLRAGNEAQALTGWKSLVEDLSVGGVPVDVNALVQWVLRQTYQESLQDLAAHAEKVKFYNEQKKAIRGHLSQLRDHQKKLSGRKTIDVRRLQVFPYEKNQLPTRVVGDPVTMTAADLDTYLDEWDQQLQNIGDDAQLANIDLQNMLQKQQQSIQTISNVSKMLHDTAMAVIRKIG